MQPLVQAEKKDPFYRNGLIRAAINRAIYDAMVLDPAVHIFGEGAYMKVHYDAPRIEQEFSDRVHTLPVSEDGNLNFAVGASLVGVKPVVDIITADFMYRAMDSIVNTAAKVNFALAHGETPKTIVVRAEFLMGGPTTGQRPEAIFTHIPGINVVLPSTPKDAYGLMRTALANSGMTLFFEDRMIKDSETRLQDYDTWEGAMPFGTASIRRSEYNSSLTLITYGLMRQVVEKTLDRCTIDGVEVIDLRTLYPLDWDTVLNSVSTTGRLLIVEPDVMYGGIGAEIAARVAETSSAKIMRLGAPRSIIPANRDLHEMMLPTEEQILVAIKGMR